MMMSWPPEISSHTFFDRSLVRLILPDDHAKQRRLAGPVRADHADDAARRQLEGQIVDQ
jgi:hypothetical protein